VEAVAVLAPSASASLEARRREAFGGNQAA
jgi:hypothetical protein